MQFNADKTEEVIFSCKRNKPSHPGLKLGEEVFASKLEHKHLGFILDSKLNFKSHIREAIWKAPRGIGLFVCQLILHRFMYIKASLLYTNVQSKVS